jgi:AraC-like DNA-binding protein
MSFDSLLTLIILLGAIQGFIVTGILLFSNAKNKIANRYLAILIFLISFASLGVYLMNIGVKYTSPTWLTISQVVPFFIVMPVGPLIYFYVRKFSAPDILIPSRERWHFASGAIDALPHIVFVIFLFGMIDISFESMNFYSDEYQTYVDIPRWASVTVYLVGSLKYLNRETSKRSEDIKKHKWLTQFLKTFLVFQAIWFLHLVPYIIPSLRNDLLESVGWYPIYLPLAGLIYYFGIKGILVSDYGPSKSVSVTTISPEKIQSILNRLKQSMVNDKLFLEPALSVAALANHIDVPAKQISAILNQIESRSFNEFVNKFRVDEFKMRVHDSKFQFMTLSGIALECGFNSNATFQRAFKAVEGISPSEYLALTKSDHRISA